MEKDHHGIFPRMRFHQLDISKGKSDIGKEQLMEQELFNPQSSSVCSSRIIYTPSTFARTSLLHLQEVGSLQAVHPHVSLTAVYDKYKERGGRPVFHPDDLTAFTSLLTDLYNLASSSDYIRDMRINEKLGTLLTLLMEQSWHPESVTISRKRLELAAVKRKKPGRGNLS